MTDHVGRRRYLATAGTLAAGSLAGCLGGETALSHGEVEREEDGGYLHFDDDGDRVATFALSYGTLANDRWRLQLHAWHDESTRLDAMRYEIHAPTVQGPMVQVFMKEPGGGPWPQFEFEGNGNETTVAVDGLGELGNGSLSLEFVLSALDEVDQLPIRVFCEYALARSGSFSGQYRATGSIQADLVDGR